MGRYLCRCALKLSTFLDYKPSQVAAACFILALNTVSHKTGLKQSVLSQFEQDERMNDGRNSENDIENHQCILENWSDDIIALTGLQRARDLKEPYTALVKNLMVSR